MNGRKHIRTLVLLVFILTTAAAATRAQEPQEPPPQQEPTPEQTQPKPAGRGLPGMEDQDNNSNQDNNQWQPDNTPTTGLENPTLGAPSLRHSYWVPGAQYGLMMQSSPFGASGSSWYETNYLSGNLSLLKEWSHSTLALNYSGGGVITNEPGIGGNGAFQQLGAGQSFQFRRWLWQWSDQFSYLPESQFGFGAGTGLAAPGVGGTLGPSVPGSGFSPNQSIISAVGPRISNSFIVQGTYTFSRRQSVTVAGLDGVLHFTETNNADSQNYLGSIGYNYLLTKEDSIGLAYRFNSFHFPGQPQAYGDSSFNVAYQKKITQRLALQASAGPDFINYRIPIGGKSTQNAWDANASLTYGVKRGSFGVSYFHGLSSGGGVLIGAEVDQVTVSGTHQISRLWSANANFGFSRNRALNSADALTLGFGNYDSYFAGGGLTRPIGRYANIAVSYTAYIERANGAVCTGPGCVAGSTSNQTQNTVTLYVNWHMRPFVIE
jgi:hypothetical protein